MILILLDDVGFGATSTFGGPVAMPALDELAKGGLRHYRFHVNSLCWPARAAPRSAAFIASILKLNGCSTAAFGKWHNIPAREFSRVIYE